MSDSYPVTAWLFEDGTWDVKFLDGMVYRFPTKQAAAEAICADAQAAGIEVGVEEIRGVLTGMAREVR